MTERQLPTSIGRGRCSHCKGRAHEANVGYWNYDSNPSLMKPSLRCNECLPLHMKQRNSIEAAYRQLDEMIKEHPGLDGWIMCIHTKTEEQVKDGAHFHLVYLQGKKVSDGAANPQE